MITVQAVPEHVLSNPLLYYITTSVFGIKCKFVQDGDMKVVIFGSDYIYYPDELPSKEELELFYTVPTSYMGMSMISTRYVPIINNARRI